MYARGYAFSKVLADHLADTTLALELYFLNIAVVSLDSSTDDTLESIQTRLREHREKAIMQFVDQHFTAQTSKEEDELSDAEDMNR